MTDHAYPSRVQRRTGIDVTDILLLIARLGIAADFFLFGLNKFVKPSAVAGLLERHHLPGFMVYPTFCLQIGSAVLLALGYQTRLAAGMLAWFCLVASSIFWSDNLANLSRDYATAGGCIMLVAYGAGGLALDARFSGRRDLVVKVCATLLSNDWLFQRVMVLARVLIAFPFLGDVVKKLLHLEAEAVLLAAHGIPVAGMYAVMLLELLLGLAVVAGYRTRFAALGLIAWCAVLGLAVHYPGYQLVSDTLSFGELVWINFNNLGAPTFFKDITTGAALLVLFVFGPGKLSLDESRRG
jgi:putative oxidoreductase